MTRNLHEYAVEEVVATARFDAAVDLLLTAMTCDAYPEELAAAARAAERLGDEAHALARRIREAGKR